MRLQLGDVGFASHRGAVSDAIRWAQQAPPWPLGISHTFVWVGSDGKAEVQANGEPLRSDLPYSMQVRNLVEANEGGAEYKSVIEYCDNPDQRVAFFRHTGLTDAQRVAIAEWAKAHADNVPYGWLNIGTALIDGLASKLFGKQVYAARKLTVGSLAPDCSVLVAEAYKAGAGYTWPGPATGGRTPWPMYQHCVAASELIVGEWECLFPLGPLSHTDLDFSEAA